MTAAGICAHCGSTLLRSDHKGMLCHATPDAALTCMRTRPRDAPLTLRKEPTS